MIDPHPEDLPAGAGTLSRLGLVTDAAACEGKRVASAMISDEKAQLLALLEHADKWCREAEARDANGHAVCFDDDAAVAWDITGALCRLFGWHRACVLFGQLERHIVGKRRIVGWPVRDIAIDAMKALQDFNDRTETTFEMLRERIEAMPIWNSGSRADGASDADAKRHDGLP